MKSSQATAHQKRTALALGPLLVMWPDEAMSEERIAVYVSVLEDIDPELLQAAVRHCIATLRFFPKPAEIRGAAFDLRARSEGLPDPMAAWGEVVSEISRVGSYGSPRFSCELIATAVRQVGGFQRLCLSENMASDRARFVEAYTQLQARHETDARMLPQVKQHVAELADRLRAERAALPPPMED